MNNITTIHAFVALVLVVTGGGVLGQNCGCAPNLCCSQWGFCGTGDPYCGQGCRSGPCYNQPPTSTGVAGIVTDSFFNSIVNRSPSSCAGRGFYTRSAFLQAIGSYPGFGTTGSNEVIRRELSAFFAHVTHETGSFCYREEINGASQNYCDTRYPCAQGKYYYGRGPLQLTWNYNYIAAGRSINFDGLNDPDIVARDPIISFRTAVWFWMNNNVHNAITTGQGFGATIRAINSIECNGGNSGAVDSRIRYYQDYCRQFGVDPGPNLRC